MDIWNNPMTKNALKALSPEQIENYRKIGEEMYGTVDFQDSKIIKTMTPMDEAVAYLEEGIKSGLLPGDLEENEVKLLSDTFGEEWYLRYGFTREEVPEVGLSLKMKTEIEDAIKMKIADHEEKKKKAKKKDKKNKAK